MGVDVVPVSEGPHHRFGGLGDVLVCVYWGTPPVSALRDRIPWIEEVVRRDGMVALFVVVTPEAAGSLPGADFRAESKRQADRWRDHFALSASVIEGDGLSHSLVRTFLRGLATVAGRDVDVRFFDRVGPAAAWVARSMAPYDGPGAAALVEAVDALRPREADQAS